MGAPAQTRECASHSNISAALAKWVMETPMIDGVAVTAYGAAGDPSVIRERVSAGPPGKEDTPPANCQTVRSDSEGRR